MGEAEARLDPGASRRERFLTAARRGAPGTVSWAPPDLVRTWLEAAGYPAGIRSGAASGQARDVPDAVLRAGQESGLDALTLPVDDLLLAQGLGAALDGRGRLARPVRVAADLERLEPCDPARILADLPRLGRGSPAASGQRPALIVQVPAPWSLACCLAGDTLPAEGLADELQELIADALLPWIGFWVESGADGIHLGDREAARLDAETWRARAAAPLERVVCGAKALGVAVLLDAGDHERSLFHLPESGADVLVLGTQAGGNPQETLAAVAGRASLAIPVPGGPAGAGKSLGAWVGARGLIVVPAGAATPCAARALLERWEGC
jgi:hypothetical protein